MENADSILQSIVAIVAMLLGGFAMFRAQKSVQDEKEARKAMDKITETAHEVIVEEADEDHEAVSDALADEDPTAAIAALVNGRNDE